MNIWIKFKKKIRGNCTSVTSTPQDIMYWRNNLFASTLIFILPLCFIALIPSLYWIIKTRIFSVAIVDFITIAILFIIALAPGFSILQRKIIFITTFYIFSVALLYLVGLKGSSLLYLLAGPVFSVLIFKQLYAHWPAWVNVFICTFFGLLIYFNWLPGSHMDASILGEWVAVSMNLIFLSFLFTALIPRLFKGLQTVINTQLVLKQELLNEKNSLDEAVQSLYQKNEELEQFSYIASHDLQEPLRMVSGFLTQLKTKYEMQLDEKAQKYIHFAVEGARRMQQTIVSLLEYSRAGNTNEIKESVDLNETLSDVKMLLSAKIEELNAVINTPQLPTIISNKILVQEIFQNIISNALKYCSPNTTPKIFISATASDSYWVISFRDNGIGIQEDDQEKVFQLFQRVHSKGEYEGSGIGLAVTKKIVDHLGGKIWVESEYSNGSTFYVTLLK